jgi:hypothetical protein
MPYIEFCEDGTARAGEMKILNTQEVEKSRVEIEEMHKRIARHKAKPNPVTDERVTETAPEKIARLKREIADLGQRIDKNFSRPDLSKVIAEAREARERCDQTLREWLGIKE